MQHTFQRDLSGDQLLDFGSLDFGVVRIQILKPCNVRLDLTQCLPRRSLYVGRSVCHTLTAGSHSAFAPAVQLQLHGHGREHRCHAPEVGHADQVSRLGEHSAEHGAAPRPVRPKPANGCPNGVNDGLRGKGVVHGNHRACAASGVIYGGLVGLRGGAVLAGGGHLHRLGHPHSGKGGLSGQGQAAGIVVIRGGSLSAVRKPDQAEFSVPVDDCIAAHQRRHVTHHLPAGVAGQVTGDSRCGRRSGQRGEGQAALISNIPQHRRHRRSRGHRGRVHLAQCPIGGVIGGNGGHVLLGFALRNHEAPQLDVLDSPDSGATACLRPHIDGDRGILQIVPAIDFSLHHGGTDAADGDGVPGTRRCCVGQGGGFQCGSVCQRDADVLSPRGKGSAESV